MSWTDPSDETKYRKQLIMQLIIVLPWAEPESYLAEP